MMTGAVGGVGGGGGAAVAAAGSGSGSVSSGSSSGSVTSTPAGSSSGNKVSNSLQTAMNGTQSNASEIQGTQDRFIKLLVTQMRNQDPLNPMDNAQVTSQLAQLSTVTGIDKLNSTMDDLIKSVQSSQSYQASNLIGRQVLTEGNSFNLNQGFGAFSVEIPSRADVMSIVIKDELGRKVKEMEMGPLAGGATPFTWNGLTDSGVQAPDGIYSIEVMASSGGSPLNAVSLAYAQVQGVTNGDNGVTLNLDNNQSISTTDIRQIL